MAIQADRRRVVEKVKSIGIGSEPRSKKKRSEAEPVEAASAVVGLPERARKKSSRGTQAIGVPPEADPSKRTIGERIKTLREEAKILALYLQEPDDEFEDEEDEDREADTEAAIGLMEVLGEVEDPSPAVVALVVEYRPRPDWSPLGRARDVRDELEVISEVFEASGIEDEGFEACLEELYGWMYEF